MNATPVDSRTAAERVSDVARILEAMNLGVREALLQHKRAGNPVAIWRDGQVVWLPPEDIPVDEAPPAREGG